MPYPREKICESCRSELEYEESDLRIGEFGCVYVDCPVCGEENMLVDNEHAITLTVDNIEFPIHFRHLNKTTGTAEVCNDEEIKKYLRRAVDYFRKNKNEYDWGGWITGDLYLQIHRYDGDEIYTVTVSNDFYVAEIPFEEEDHK